MDYSEDYFGEQTIASQKRVIENQDKANKWQAAVIKFAEELLQQTDKWREYLDKKWKI